MQTPNEQIPTTNLIEYMKQYSTIPLFLAEQSNLLQTQNKMNRYATIKLLHATMSSIFFTTIHIIMNNQIYKLMTFNNFI